MSESDPIAAVTASQHRRLLRPDQQTCHALERNLLAKSCGWALVERNGRVRSFHVPNVTARMLHPILARHAHRDSRFMTDEFRA